MTLVWRRAAVELADGYGLTTDAGAQTQAVDAAWIAIEGGFVHIEVAGTDAVQVVSAPAVRRISYPAESHPREPR